MLPRFNKPSHVFQPVPPHSALVSGSLDHFLRKARVAYPYAVLRRWVGRASLSMTPLFAVSILSSEAAPPAPTLPAGEPLAESGRSAAASAERVGSLNVQPGLQIKFLDQRPRIDGLLDEPGWQQAAVLNDFKQVEPREGAEPTEQTEVRVFHNKDYLWIGIMCFDRDPGAVIGREMQRDAHSDSDDMVTLVFDPFRGKRTGYLFRVSAGGAIQDALLEADGNQKTGWDTIWSGRVRKHAQGWTVEIEIPFKSVSFDARSSTWGFNMERIIRRKQETVRWSAPLQNHTITSLSQLGELRGLTDIRQGLGLEVKPFAVAKFREQQNGKDTGFDWEPGVDLFYSITPSLTASLTINTDFAEAEVDERQVNLTRFPLFFPEKRDFFLQDANLFSFDGYKGPLAFHSRRIGLGPGGEEVGIMAGGKITGRIGKLDLGILDVQIDSSGDIPEKNLGVARASYQILKESAIGGIVTYGNPLGKEDNYLVGLDFNYQNSQLHGNKIFKAQIWAMRSHAENRDGNQMAFGGSLRCPNEPVSAEIHASQIGEDFDPALGFVRRRGIRQFGGKLGYRWRPGGYIRSWGIQVAPYYVTDLDGKLQTEATTLPSIDFLNQAGDSLSIGITHNQENFSEQFEISPGVVIPAGIYQFRKAYGLLTTTTARPLSAFVSADAGGFYGGRSTEFGGGIEWRPNSRFYLSAQGTHNRIDLPAGEFDVIVALLRANVSFSPTLTWNSIVQFDNLSKSLGLNSRLKWIVRPGSNIFLVLNYGFDAEDGRFQTLASEITTKLGWSFRF